MAMNSFFESAAAATLAAGFVLSPMAANAADKIGTAKSFDIRKKSMGAQQKLGPALAAKYQSVVLMVRGGEETFVESIRNASSKVEEKIGMNILVVHTLDNNPDDGLLEVEVNIPLTTPVMWNAGRFGEELLEERLAAVINYGLDQKDKAASSGR